MSDKAETVTCDECFGRYKQETCSKCSGTGVRTTGEVAGTLPSSPDPVTDEPCEPTITVTTSGVATPPYPDRYIEPPPNTPTSKSICDHCGGRGKVLGPLDEIQTCGLCDGTGDEWIPGSIFNSAPRLHVNCACDECAKADPRDATIAEQAAEIERLKAALTLAREQYGQNAGDAREALLAVDRLKDERDTLRNALEIAAARSDSQSASIAYFEQESASHDVALGELTTDRDTLRLEVQRLKDENLALNQEAASGRAALEQCTQARDNLRHKLEGLKDERFEAQDRYAALEAERDALAGRLATQQEFIDDYRKARDLREDAADQLLRERNAANARAEKYLRVIETGDRERLAIIAMHNAAMRAQGARSIAGLPTYVHEPTDAEEPHE